MNRERHARDTIERRLRTDEPPAPPLPDDFAARLAARLPEHAPGPSHDPAPIRFGAPAWMLPAAIAAALFVAITVFIVLRPASPPPSRVVVDPPARSPARLATLDVQEPLRAEARLMVDDVRRFSRRFRMPALLSGVSPSAVQPAASPKAVHSPT